MEGEIITLAQKCVAEIEQTRIMQVQMEETKDEVQRLRSQANRDKEVFQNATGEYEIGHNRLQVTCLGFDTLSWNQILF